MRSNSNNTYIYSHHPFSNGARALATALRARRIRHTGSRFVGSVNKTVINWGSTALPEQVRACNVLNSPLAVECASNKIAAFRIMAEAGVRTPDFTVDRAVSVYWLNHGDTVVCRTLTRASAGRGIVLVRGLGDPLPQAPLYTKYVKKMDEYRVHVFKGEVVLVQKKMRRSGLDNEDVNYQIRTHDNGFIYGVEGVEAPVDVAAGALCAVASLSLAFGAVDVVYNSRRDKAYVLEVNTAPGLAGRTVEAYSTAIQSYLDSQQHAHTDAVTAITTTGEIIQNAM